MADSHDHAASSPQPEIDLDVPRRPPIDPHNESLVNLIQRSLNPNISRRFEGAPRILVERGAKRALEFVALRSQVPWVVSTAVRGLRQTGATREELLLLFEKIASRASDGLLIEHALPSVPLGDAILKLLSVRETAAHPDAVRAALIDLAVTSPGDDLLPLRENQEFLAELSTPFPLLSPDGQTILFDLLTGHVSRRAAARFIESQSDRTRRSLWPPPTRHVLVIYLLAVLRVLTRIPVLRIEPGMLKKLEFRLRNVQIHPSKSFQDLDSIFESIGHSLLLNPARPDIFLIIAREIGRWYHHNSKGTLDPAKEVFFAELSTAVFAQATGLRKIARAMRKRRIHSYRAPFLRSLRENGLVTKWWEAAGAQLEAVLRYSKKHHRKVDWYSLYQTASRIDGREPRLSLSQLGQRLMNEAVKPVESTRFKARPMKQDSDEGNYEWRIFIPTYISRLAVLLAFLFSFSNPVFHPRPVSAAA